MPDVLTERDFVAAAFALQCEVDAVKAVCAVEAPRGGFTKGGLPIVLFEGHIFSKYTKGRFDQTDPTLSYPKWTTKFYAKSPEGEWERLRQAATLDRRAALMSASWGKFQIMGFNYALCGYASLDEFVADMHKAESFHLDAFVEYITHTGLNDELQAHDWKNFARLYNGPEYWKNKYDEKLAAAYVNLRRA